MMRDNICLILLFLLCEIIQEEVDEDSVDLRVRLEL
jgi:hypothetical protein